MVKRPHMENLFRRHFRIKKANSPVGTGHFHLEGVISQDAIRVLAMKRSLKMGIAYEGLIFDFPLGGLPAQFDTHAYALEQQVRVPPCRGGAGLADQTAR